MSEHRDILIGRWQYYRDNDNCVPSAISPISSYSFWRLVADTVIYFLERT